MAQLAARKETRIANHNFRAVQRPFNLRVTGAILNMSLERSEEIAKFVSVILPDSETMHGYGLLDESSVDFSF